MTINKIIRSYRSRKKSNYDYYEALEEQAFSDRMSRKKKPKKQKKSYKKEEIKNVKRDKKNTWSNHPKRI